MSKAEDVVRAKQGLIFRDGQLVNAKDWYKAHPTAKMLAEQQSEVDKVVAEQLALMLPKESLGGRV